MLPNGGEAKGVPEWWAQAREMESPTKKTKGEVKNDQNKQDVTKRKTDREFLKGANKTPWPKFNYIVKNANKRERGTSMQYDRWLGVQFIAARAN